MPTVRPSKADLAKARRKTDWRRLDALTDKAIDRAIADDPDAAPVQRAPPRRFPQARSPEPSNGSGLMTGGTPFPGAARDV
jgi:hypothetical protein